MGDSRISWIETVPDSEWSSDDNLRELHGGVVDSETGRVDHIMAVHSLNPRGMAAHQSVYSSAMTGTPSLRKAERELIALVVSLENHCHY